MGKPTHKLVVRLTAVALATFAGSMVVGQATGQPSEQWSVWQSNYQIGNDQCWYKVFLKHRKTVNSLVSKGDIQTELFLGGVQDMNLSVAGRLRHMGGTYTIEREGPGRYRLDLDFVWGSGRFAAHHQTWHAFISEGNIAAMSYLDDPDKPEAEPVPRLTLFKVQPMAAPPCPERVGN
jgi:hypothetical protein